MKALDQTPHKTFLLPWVKLICSSFELFISVFPNLFDISVCIGDQTNSFWHIGSLKKTVSFFQWFKVNRFKIHQENKQVYKICTNMRKLGMARFSNIFKIHYISIYSMQCMSFSKPIIWEPLNLYQLIAKTHYHHFLWILQFSILKEKNLELFRKMYSE